MRSKRRVREQWNAPAAEQSLIWLDGEALCVTPAFGQALAQRRLGAPARLLCRTRLRPLAALWAWLRGAEPATPEVAQASTLFRLERHGIPTPRVLALGQRRRRATTRSFLLTEPFAATVPLCDWLAREVNCRARRAVVTHAAQIVRRLHEAGCLMGRHAAQLLHVQVEDRAAVVLDRVDHLRSVNRVTRRRARNDLRLLYATLADVCSRSEALRFLLVYHGERHVTRPVRDCVRHLTWRRRFQEARA